MARKRRAGFVVGVSTFGWHSLFRLRSRINITTLPLILTTPSDSMTSYMRTMETLHVSYSVNRQSQDFEYELKAHIFCRLPGGDALPPAYIPTDDDLFRVRITGDKMYQHSILRVNYTRYDMRRDQDSINPRTHSDIMMLAPDGAAHPYLYARVLGIFHVLAYLAGDDLDGADDTEPEIIDILWVRWFDPDPRAPGGFEARRLPRLKWAGLDDDTFGFVSPDRVLRAAHLMPALAHGRSDAALPGYSVARSDDEEEDEDWNYHYVGIFVDHDMFMRYYGDAVGHQCSKPNKPQAPPVAPAPITRLAGRGYDDEVDEELAEDTAGSPTTNTDISEVPDQPVDAEDEGSGSEDCGSDEDGGTESSRESDRQDDEDDEEEDGDLGFEDGEVEMGEDERELALAGFAPW
ncbi:hypothetical protein V8D89_004760 [Ganoderma adspersum]